MATVDDDSPPLQDLFVSREVNDLHFIADNDGFCNTRYKPDVKTLVSESSIVNDYKIVQFFELDDVPLGHTHLMKPYSTDMSDEQNQNVFLSLEVDKVKFDIDDDAEFTSTVTSDINAMAADPDDMDEFSLSQFTKVQQDGVDDNFHLITQIKTPLDLMNDDVKPFIIGMKEEEAVKQCKKKKVEKRAFVAMPYENCKRMPSAAVTAKAKYIAKEYQQTLVDEDYDSENEIYLCQHCNREYRNLRSLKAHIYQKHKTGGHHPCPECGRVFKAPGYLRSHMSVHMEIKPYKCTICPKTFGQKELLKKHLRMHKNYRPYECRLCPWRFPMKSGLDLHMVTHSTERPFECHICGKTYKDVKTLRLHSIVHTDEKRFKCKHCPERFRWDYLMRKHMREECQAAILSEEGEVYEVMELLE